MEVNFCLGDEAETFEGFCKFGLVVGGYFLGEFCVFGVDGWKFGEAFAYAGVVERKFCEGGDDFLCADVADLVFGVGCVGQHAGFEA